MSCTPYEAALLDAARGAILDAAGAAHVRECARCTEWLEEQRALSALLVPLADAPLPAAPPLPEALRARLRSVPPRASRIHPRWFLLPASSAAVLAWIVLRTPIPVPAPVHTAAVLPMQPEVRASATPPASPAMPRAETARAPRRARIRPPTQVPERATRFVSVPYAEAYGAADGFQLVRVAMPRSALVRYGWPAVRDPRPVTADVLVGSDGLARAIRLVETR